MGLAHSPRVVTDGLVLCLDAANQKSYPGTGTVWTDLSGNSSNGTLTNGPTYDSANGGSIVFDGVNDYVEATPIIPSYLTLSTWFKATGVPSTNDSAGGAIVVSSPQLYAGALQYYLSYSWVNQRMVFTIQGNNSFSFTSDNSIIRNTVHNITVTYDGSFKKIYHNGQLLKSDAWTTDPVYPTTGNINTQIGRWGYGGYARHFNGNIYSAGIYDRALSAAEVQQNFNATRGRYGI